MGGGGEGGEGGGEVVLRSTRCVSNVERSTVDSLTSICLHWLLVAEASILQRVTSAPGVLIICYIIHRLQEGTFSGAESRRRDGKTPPRDPYSDHGARGQFYTTQFFTSCSALALMPRAGLDRRRRKHPVAATRPTQRENLSDSGDHAPPGLCRLR